MVVCSTCIGSTHVGHPVHQLDDGIKLIRQSLDSKKVKLDDKISNYIKTEEMYTSSYNEIESSYNLCKTSIIDGFKVLKNIIEKREADLLQEITTSETAKLEKSKKELDIVRNAMTFGSSVTAHIKNVSDRPENKLESLKQLMVIESQMEQVYNNEEIDEFPITELPLEKFLYVNECVEAVNSLKLTSVVDPRKSNVSADLTEYTVIGSEIKLSVYLKGRYDIINPFHGGQHIKIEVGEKPIGSKPTITQTMTESRILVSLKGDYEGTYSLRVTCGDKDIKGSPFECVFYPEVEDVIEVPDKLTSGGCYHSLHKEFWIKTRDKIYGYNLKGTQVRMLESTMTQYSCDEQGNCYGADGDKSFMKFDKVFREKWSVFPAEGKGPVTTTVDDHYAYAIYKQGPLLILSKENGNTVQVVTIKEVDNVVSMIAYEEHLLIVDGGLLKLFNKKGKLLKVFDEYKQIGAITIVNRMVYVCQEKSNKWIRIMSPRHYTQAVSEARKQIKLPSLYFSPKLTELDGKEGIGRSSTGSFVLSKLPLSPRNSQGSQSMKK
jgi:hypothetical protein